MGVSDLITLIGLVIAIITLISEQNRDFLLLKFTPANLICLILVFLFINYLVFYDYFRKISFYPESLDIDGFPYPKDWAYVITLGTVAYLIYKIFYDFFPEENRGKVIAYYNKLLFNDEHLNIISLFEKYHKTDLLEHLKDSSKRGNRIAYANNIYHDIISRDDFLHKTANLRPYFYSDIVRTFTGREYINEHVVNTYIETLISNNNLFLARELKNNQNFKEGGFSYRLPEENKILIALLSNLDVAENNLIWQPFGEGAIKELRSELAKGFTSYLNKSYEDKSELWGSITFNSINFFNIMVRKGIEERYESHLWLHYYRYFVEDLANVIVIDEMNNIEEDAEFPTRAHYLIYECFSNLRAWIKYCADHDNDFHSSDTTKCLGSCLKVLCASTKVNDDFKIARLKSVIKLFFTTYSKRNENNTNANLIDCYLRPGLMDPELEYKRLFNIAWRNFDKVPYQRNGFNSSITAFENSVLNVLNQI